MENEELAECLEMNVPGKRINNANAKVKKNHKK